MGAKSVPSSLPECFVALERILSKDQIHALKICKKEDLVMHHFGLGTWMRNAWGLWHESPLAQDLVKRGVEHPDNMSGYILEAFHKHLQSGQEPKGDEDSRQGIFDLK